MSDPDSEARDDLAAAIPDPPGYGEVRDIQALAACSPLGRFTSAHFAGDAETGVLHAALRLYLELRHDERLLVIIDPSGGRSALSGCALTTRRLHWPAAEATRVTITSFLENEAGPLPPYARSIAYDEIREVTPDGRLILASPAEATEDPSLLPHDGAVRDVLVGVLNTLARHARDGAPPMEAENREALGRDLRGIERRTSEVLSMQGDLRKFPDLLRATVRRVYAVPILAALNVLIFAIMVRSGVSIAMPDALTISAWGGSSGPGVVFDGEAWRLLSSTFLHLGLIHLAANMWVLLRFGPLVERLFGTPAFVATYLLSGLSGALASLWWHPLVVSAGASGSLFGLVGGLIGYLAVRRDVAPESILWGFRPALLVYLAIDSVLGLFVPSVDGAAHVGGLCGGWLCGLLLNRPWPPPRFAYGRARRIVSSCAIAAGLVLVFLAIRPGIRARLEADPQVVAAMRETQDAVNEHNDFLVAMTPMVEEFSAIEADYLAVVGRSQRRQADAEVLARELNAIILRAEANRTRLVDLAVTHPDLRSARDDLISAQDHYTLAMRAVSRFFSGGDEAGLAGPDGFESHTDAVSEKLKSYENRLRLYRDHYNLIPATDERAQEGR